MSRVGGGPGRPQWGSWGLLWEPGGRRIWEQVETLATSSFPPAFTSLKLGTTTLPCSHCPHTQSQSILCTKEESEAQVGKTPAELLG